MRIRSESRHAARWLVQESPLSPAIHRVLAKAFRRTAFSGEGGDLCLKEGFLPVPVHYYSPIPDIDDLRARHIWDVRSSMVGIDFREAVQEALLASLATAYGAECHWPFDSTSDSAQFFLNNQSFRFGCAGSTHSMVRRFRPRSVIEIGSGHSSRVIAAALECNRRDAGVAGPPINVDPDADGVLRGDALPATDVIAERVELLDTSFFSALGEGDILFIDSGHSVRIGGDVNFLFLDVLPRLAPGVIVHIHDIALPYEYPMAYATNERFRQFWTEQYLLQAFLALNRSFEILLAMNWLMVERMELFRRAFPHYDPVLHPFFSGSFWIRRVQEGAA